VDSAGRYCRRAVAASATTAAALEGEMGANLGGFTAERHLLAELAKVLSEIAAMTGIERDAGF
jgi:hypothetical protein